MKLSEFEKHNRNKDMPREWIGQGWGYKEEKAWDEIDNDEIIYIPEYGYTDDGTVDRENAYNKRDLREVVKQTYPKLKGERLDTLASILFNSIDWQFPETAIDEDWLLDDETKDEYKQGK